MNKSNSEKADRTVVIDIEANGLEPTEIHCIVCRDVKTGEVNVFQQPLLGNQSHGLFTSFASTVGIFVGHNILGYDQPAIAKVLGYVIPVSACIDTLVVSRLIDAVRKHHSLEAWGHDFGLHKVGADITDWSVWTQEMEDRCVSDTEINLRLYKHLLKYINSPRWASALETEHFIAAQCHILHQNGFAFDYPGAVALKKVIDQELGELDETLRVAFPPRSSLIREISPRATKFHTINRVDFRWLDSDDLSDYSVGCPFSRIEFVPFNPASPSQIVERLNEAGWRPYEKTKGHKEAEKSRRDISRKKKKGPADAAALKDLEIKLARYAISGWSISEENLDTLPSTAPAAAHTLARRLKLGNRSSTLQSWLNAAVQEPDGQYRIHGSFAGIGAWTHRMSHSNPNQGNIPKFDSRQPHKTPYSDRMRSLWQAGKSRLLVGVDAESIQLRIFGHYIDDEEFIKSLLVGKKEDGTDPHSVNWRALGSPCKSRDDAKTFVYAFLLGAGDAKVAAILGCSLDEAKEAKANFIERYPGLKYLKDEVIPNDAERGYFTGFDGRLVRIRGVDYNSRRHFALGGYLQNGEQCIMKRSAQIWEPKLRTEGIPFKWVNFVHDEFQIEGPDDVSICQYIAVTVANAIEEVGQDLKLKCPMAGSVLSDHGMLIDGKKWAIGKDWMVTH